MRTEYKLFIRLAIFMTPLALVYALAGGFFDAIEPAGVIMLALLAVSFAFIGIYLLVQSKRMDGLRPEDYDADPQDGAGVVGAFPAASVWPFLGALGAVMLAYGMVFTSFLAIPGIFLIVATVIGMARETEEAHLGHADLDANNSTDAEAVPTFSDQVKR